MCGLARDRGLGGTRGQFSLQTSAIGLALLEHLEDDRHRPTLRRRLSQVAELDLNVRMPLLGTAFNDLAIFLMDSPKRGVLGVSPPAHIRPADRPPAGVQPMGLATNALTGLARCHSCHGPTELQARVVLLE